MNQWSCANCGEVVVETTAYMSGWRHVLYPGQLHSASPVPTSALLGGPRVALVRYDRQGNVSERETWSRDGDIWTMDDVNDDEQAPIADDRMSAFARTFHAIRPLL